MKVNPKQMEAVLALPGVKRFEHFIEFDHSRTGRNAPK